MGLPITVVIEDKKDSAKALQSIRDYFQTIDEKYSPYKPSSEVSWINSGLNSSQWNSEMKTIWRLCKQTERQTNGYFNAWHEGHFDPSGLVKGWSINQAATNLRKLGFKNFYIDAGGDIQVNGHNSEGQPWSIGIRNPFNRNEVVKVLRLTRKGVATSGTYIRGQHIYDPHSKKEIKDIASLTVIGSNIYEADRFATAAFAMGRSGITFIQSLKDFEGLMITSDKKVILTSGFERYVEPSS